MMSGKNADSRRGFGALSARGLILLGLTAGACVFSPPLPEDKIVCGSDNECPGGYSGCEPVPGLPIAVCCDQPGCGAALNEDEYEALRKGLEDGRIQPKGGAGGPGGPGGGSGAVGGFGAEGGGGGAGGGQVMGGSGGKGGSAGVGGAVAGSGGRAGAAGGHMAGSGGGGGLPVAGSGGTAGAGGMGGSAPRRALYVVGDAVLLTPGEEIVDFRLQAKGFAVTAISGALARPLDAMGMTVVLISDSVPASIVDSTFRDVPTPVVCMQRNLFDNMGMTGTSQGTDYGDNTGVTSLVVNGASEFGKRSGLSGTVMIAFEGGTVGWGGNFTAEIGATIAGFPSRAALFGYRKGQPMPGGLTAPSSRVGYGPWASTAANFTEEGLKLLDAAVDFAIAFK